MNGKLWINIYKHAAAKISVEDDGERGRQIKEREKTHDVAEWNSVIMGIAIEQINSSLFLYKKFFRAFL
jgi:hypothetical protein